MNAHKPSSHPSTHSTCQADLSRTGLMRAVTAWHQIALKDAHLHMSSMRVFLSTKCQRHWRFSQRHLLLLDSKTPAHHAKFHTSKWYWLTLFKQLSVPHLAVGCKAGEELGNPLHLR